jgi:hypothetical protein
MLEVQLGSKTIDLPYTISVYGVAEEMFDEFVDEDTKAELIDCHHQPAMKTWTGNVQPPTRQGSARFGVWISRTRDL